MNKRIIVNTTKETADQIASLGLKLFTVGTAIYLASAFIEDKINK